MDRERLINIAVIGAGNIAKRHLENLAFLGGNRIAAICDLDENLARAKAATYGAQAYTDWEKVFEEVEDLGAILICTPPILRKPVIQAAVQHNVPFLCEKPPAQSLREAREIVALLQNTRLIHSVGFNQRYAPSVDRCLELLEGRQINLVNASVITSPGLTRNLGADWFYLKEKGGSLFDNTIHTLDVIRYIAGDIDAVHALGSNITIPISDNFTIEDSMSINLQFSSGAIGCVLLSWACAQRRNDLTFFGRDIRLSLSTIPPRIEGMVGAPDEKPRSISEQFPQGPAMGRSGEIHPNRRPQDPPDPPHFEEIKVFLNAIRNPSLTSAIRSDFADAARTTALLHAIEASIASENVEKVPLIEGLPRD